MSLLSLKRLYKLLKSAAKKRVDQIKRIDGKTKEFTKELVKQTRSAIENGSPLDAEQLLGRSGWDSLVVNQVNPALQDFITSKPFVLADDDISSDDIRARGSLVTPARFASRYAFRQLDRVRLNLTGALENINDAGGLGAEVGTQVRTLIDSTRQIHAQVRTITDTALSGLQSDGQRAIAEQDSSLGDEERFYLYLGPDDDRVIRPFCNVLANLAIPEKYISQLNNGQGLSVRRFLGGYNCRHSWVVVPATYVKQNGIKVATLQDIKRANRAARRRRAA